MQVTSSSFTVAEYCNQMEDNKIVVNRDYQRSAKVWPPAARSYLIDTILLGFPIPKLSLYQRTDLKSRQTIKEIVDGQQRSEAILGFYNDEFRISGKSQFSGKRFSQLDEETQVRFLDYQLSVDVFVSATERDIRQMFRRINSYTVPLNRQEYRHATYQGEFKWFIVDLTEQYAQLLKDIGVFNENQLSRMRDAELISEIIMATSDGIASASQNKLDAFYEEHDANFEESEAVSRQLNDALTYIANWKQLHNSPLMKPYNFYSLILAVLHTLRPTERLADLEPNIALSISALGDDQVITNLSLLAASLEDPENYKNLSDFVEAGSSATTTLKNRTIRFRYFLKALGNTLSNATL